MPKTHTKKSRVFTLPRLIVLAIILILSFIAMWFALRAALVNALVNTIENSETQGYEIGHDALSVDGFPFSIQARSRSISVRAPNSQALSANTNWFVKLDEVFVQTKTLTPLSWSAQHTGQIRIDMRGFDGTRYMFDMVPASIQAQATANIRGQLKAFNVNIQPAAFTSLVGAPAPIQSTGAIKGHFQTVKTQGHLTIRGHDIKLSPQAAGLLGSTLGRTIESTALNAEITQWKTMQNRGAAAWQNSGGRVIGQNWSLKWADLDIVGTFDIGFVDTLPDGTIHIEIQDLPLLLDRLTQSGLLPAAIAKQARMFLGAVETNESGRQELDITIQKGVVKYGFLTLYKF